MKKLFLLITLIIPSLVLAQSMTVAKVQNMSNETMQCAFYQNNWAGSQQISGKTVGAKASTGPLGARTNNNNTYSIKCWSPTAGTQPVTQNLKPGTTSLKWGLKGWQ